MKGTSVLSLGKDSKSEGINPSPVSLVPEEKVSFGLYALSVSSFTVAKIRKVYNKLDSKAIAKQVCWETSQLVCMTSSFLLTYFKTICLMQPGTI